MNIRSAELLQNALQGAGQNLLAQRELKTNAELERQRIGVEQAFRNAMMQHYANIEEKQGDTANIAEKRAQAADDAVEKKYGVQQSMQALADAQQQMTVGLQELALDQKLTPEQKTQYFQQSIDSQPQYKATFLQNPMWNALYQGQGDWGTVANAVQLHRATGGAVGGPRPPSANPEAEKETAQMPQQTANSLAAMTPGVLDAKGNRTAPVVVPPALTQKNGMMAGDLRAAGDPAAVYDAAGLSMGTNATLKPNTTPGKKGYMWNDPDTTNSFSLTPGGVSQQALADVAALPGGTNLLAKYGFPAPGAPSSGTNAFGSPEDVRTAYQAGKIDKPTATQILQTQFGMQ